jgi:hypothetical protein
METSTYRGDREVYYHSEDHARRAIVARAGDGPIYVLTSSAWPGLWAVVRDVDLPDWVESADAYGNQLAVVAVATP